MGQGVLRKAVMCRKSMLNYKLRLLDRRSEAKMKHAMAL